LYYEISQIQLYTEMRYNLALRISLLVCCYCCTSSLLVWKNPKNKRKSWVQEN